MNDSARPSAIVTGASRGIGRAIALALATAGHDVLVNYARDDDAAATVVDAVIAAGADAIAVKSDIAVDTAPARLVERAVERWGRLDVVVNNAGISANDTLIADTPEDAWLRMLDINLNGCFRMVRAAIPVMRRQGSGNIVNLSSNATQRLPATFGPYTVSKAALEALTRILAKEEGPHGIRVNAVAPGPVGTDMLAGLLENMGAERARAFVESVPLRRTGEPEEIAAIVAMLVSDTASYLTGQVVYVNGGGPGG